MKRHILFLALFAVVTITSCGQNNPVQSSDPMAIEENSVANRVTVYNSITSGSLSEYLSLKTVQLSDLKTVTDRDISQRNSLIETTRQGNISYEMFTQRRNVLNQKFSDHFLNLLSPDQSYSYETLRTEALNAFYVAKNEHRYWNFIKVVEMIEE